MKKTTLQKIYFTLILSALTILFTVMGIVSVSASEIKNPIANDTFTDLSFNNSINNDIWEKYGDDGNTIKQDNSSGESPSLKMTSSTEGCPCYTKEKYDIKSIQFDIKICGEIWRGVDFKSDISTSKTIYSSPIIYTNTMILTNGGSPLYNHSSNDNKNLWATYKIVPNSNYNAVDIYYALKGEELSKVVSDYSIDVSVMHDSYVLLGSADASTNTFFDNVIIELNGGTTITETFDSGVTYFNTDNSDYISIYSDGKLSINDAPVGARVIAANPVKIDNSIVENLISANISFDIKLLDDNSKIGLLIGLDNSTDYESNGSYFFEFSKTEVKLIKYVSSSKQQIGTSFAFNDLAQNTRVNITINKNGQVIVKEGADLVAEFTIDKYSGYYGFASLSENANAELGNITINSLNYFVPVTKSLTNNFSTDYIGGEETMDFYMIGDPEDSVKIEDGKLVYNGASDRSVFCPCYEYDNFILDYKINNIYVGTSSMDIRQKTQDNIWFGLDISRAHYYTPYYGTYLMLYFTITPTTETVGLAAYTTDGVDLPENLKVEKLRDIPANYLTDIHYDGETVKESDIKDGDSLCVRWVSEGDSLKLYMKKAKDQNFTQYYSITGVEINGYVSLCCTGFTYLKIDDFSIANTSNVYTCASNEPPEVVTKEIYPKYDYNKYIATGTFEDELNLVSSSNGLNVVSYICIGVAVVAICFGVAMFIFSRRKTDEKNDK